MLVVLYPKVWTISHKHEMQCPMGHPLEMVSSRGHHTRYGMRYITWEDGHPNGGTNWAVGHPIAYIYSMRRSWDARHPIDMAWILPWNHPMGQPIDRTFGIPPWDILWYGFRDYGTSRGTVDGKNHGQPIPWNIPYDACHTIRYSIDAVL